MVRGQGAAAAADSFVRVRFSTHFQVRACNLLPALLLSVVYSLRRTSLKSTA